MTGTKKKWIYPITRHRRGITAMVTAVIGELLFCFFLLVGFGEHLWAVAACGVISVLMVLLFLSGLSLSRSGRGGVEATTECLILYRGKKRISLPWAQLEPIRFGGIFQPLIILKAGAARAVIYKALPGYPQVWSRLSPFQRASFPSEAALTFRCHGTSHLGAIAGSTLLFFSAAVILPVFGIPGGIAPILAWTVASVFALGAALGGWFMLRIRCRYTLDNTGITCRSWGKATHVPASTMTEAILEQARIRELAVDYRYRGEAMTTAVRYASMDLGLGIKVRLTDGEWQLDETMTGFPMERLYEELCYRYHLPGQIVIPEAVILDKKTSSS